MQTLQPAQTLVVIDYNPSLLELALSRLGAHGSPVRVLENTGPKGLSGARNTGLEAATGDIVAFLDDDAFADRRWLEHLVAPYDDPRVVAVGGRIVPSWESDRPAWFPEEFDWVIGCTYRGMPEDRAAVRNVIGANMSFRRDVLARVGGFSPELGRTADAPLGDEETEACIRARQLTPGSVVLYEPAAVVAHWVPDTRGRWEYFEARCFGEGVSKALLTGRLGTAEGLSSERSYTLRTLPRGVLKGLADGLSGRDRGGFSRAGAILGGFIATGMGYVRGRFTRTFGPAPALEPIVGEGPPRVLVVTPRFPPLTGGVEHHVLQVARRLTPDAELTVLTTDPGGELPAEEIVEGVHVRRVRAWPRNRDYYVAPAVWRTITHGDWDLIHVQSYHTAVAPLAMLAAIDADIPFVVTFHGGGHSSPLRRRLRRLQHAVLRPLLARAERLIAVAHFEADFYAKRLRIPRERFAVIPNGSDLPAPETPVLRVAGAGPLLISVGRLEEYKGHHRVVEAMPRVLQSFPGARLLVLGTGPYKDEIARLAESLGVGRSVEIRSVPADDRLQMAETLASADLVVLMSSFETHPLAVIEALAVGTPALVADTSGLAELARSGLARSLPLESDAGAIAEAIVEDLRHPRAVPDVELPTWEQCAGAIRRIYDEALEKRRVEPETAAAPARQGASNLPMVASLSGCGMLAVTIADNAGRQGASWAVPLFWAGLLLIFAPAALSLMMHEVSRREALGTLVVVGVALYVMSILDNPSLFTGFDELLHYRTLDDLVRTGRVFTENPLLPISPYFPGLELVTAAVMALTGMSGFAAGVAVVGVARLLTVLGLYLLLERTGLTSRMSGLGVLMYMTAPSFVYFDAQFAYESLALPLAILVLFMLREAQLQRPGLRRQLVALAAVAAFAVTVTHHVTSYILTGALLAWLLLSVLFRRRYRDPLPGQGWVPVFAVAAVLTWLLVVARKTAAYLWPHLGGSLAEVMRIINGESRSRQLFQSAGGQSAPVLERLIGLLAVALVLGLIFFGIRRVLARSRTSALVLLLGATVLAYPASMALRFTDVGWQVGSRAMAFIYVGLAFVMACGIESVRNFKKLRFGPVALTVFACIVFAGGIIAGASAHSRVSRPYQPGAGKTSIDAEGVGAASWARKVLGPGNRIAADATISSLMGSYGQQRTLSSADEVSVSGLFLAPDFGEYQLSMIAEGDIEFVVIDRRIANIVPYQGFFFEKWERQVVDYGSVVSTETVGRFDTIDRVSRIYDSGNIQVYDIRKLAE